MDIASFIDHTILKPNTTPEEIKQICKEGLQYQFGAVCIPPYYVSLAKKESAGKLNIATVIGFPLGYSSISAKKAEIINALQDGADEIDFVINQCALFSENWTFLKEEILKCIEPIRLKNKKIKVIIESGSLTENQIIKCCEIYAAAKVDFLKTSTGYSSSGASIKAVRIMRENLPNDIEIKASGGIKDYQFAKELIDHGASRIGTSSGIAIIENKHIIHETI